MLVGALDPMEGSLIILPGGGLVDGYWGTGSPRWLLVLGIVVGPLYLAILPIVLVLAHRSQRHAAGANVIGLIVISVLGVLTMVGCINRLRKQTIERQWLAMATRVGKSYRDHRRLHDRSRHTQPSPFHLVNMCRRKV